MSAGPFVEEVLIVATLIVAWCLLFAMVAIQIHLYQGLSGLLAGVTIWTAIITGTAWTALLAVIPIGLAVLVPLLIRRVGGLNGSTSRGQAIALPFGNLKRLATSLLSTSLPAAVLTIIALVLTVVWWDLPLHQAAGVMLIVVGLCIWLVRTELIAQALGWLVMDHGLFLLAEPLVLRSGPASAVLIVLSLYLLIPLIYLLFVLPRLLQSPLGFDVDHHRNLRG